MTNPSPAGRPAPSPPRKRPTPQQGNAHPWRTTLLLAVLVFVLIVVAGSLFLSQTKTGPELLGVLYGEGIPGFIALGIWAKRSKTRWSAGGWAVRTLLCVGVSIAALALFVTLGSVINPKSP